MWHLVGAGASRGAGAPRGAAGPSPGQVWPAAADSGCDRTAQNNSILSPKPVHVAIKQ
jgi:hypothetical protein